MREQKRVQSRLGTLVSPVISSFGSAKAEVGSEETRRRKSIMTRRLSLQDRQQKSQTSAENERTQPSSMAPAKHNDNPTPESMASSGVCSSMSTNASLQGGEQVDKKSLHSLQTPLSVIRVTPLSALFSNKVGSIDFRPDQHRSLMNYRQQSMQLSNNVNLVLPASTRKVRDSGSLLFLLAFIGFLAYIIWDGMQVKGADINLIVHGHDSYGNICGRNNQQIRFVEKSGKNYTDKPYTKYTLINSQFERYTLVSNHMRNGELIYVKEQNPHQQVYDLRLSQIASSKASQNGGEQSSSAKRSSEKQLSGEARLTKDRLVVQVKPNGNNKRTKRASSSSLDLEMLQKNRTLLNNLKSNLMYQYPPMYGYSSSLAPPSGNNQLIDSVDLEIPKSGANSNDSGGLQQRSVQFGGDSALRTTEPPPSYTSAMRPSTTQRPLAAQSSNGTTLRTLITFDDQLGGNDSDRYDHMLVTPTTTNFRARIPSLSTPNGLNHNEVSNQLLYLTECVSYCPSDHVELIFYRCMPSNWRFSLFPNAINVTRTFIDDILTDVSHCFRELIYTFSLALVLSLGLLILLRFLASIIIWACIMLLISLFLSLASYSWLTYYYQILDLNNLMPHDSMYTEKLALSDKWLIGSIFLTFLTFATIGTVLFMRKRILLVTMLFRESGKAIADMPLLLLQPLLTFAALVGITVAWSIGLICLQSMKQPIVDISTGFVVFKAETLYKIMKWYHIFAFLWVSHFAIACQHYVIGASVSKWYFSPNRYNLNSPIGASISELILYYLGSVALGSFLVAIFKVIRIITRQIQFLVQRNCMSSPSNSNAHPMDSNSALLGSAPVSSSCCGSFTYVWRLFIWFFDNIVMIINRDAYVEIAIHGYSFLTGARRAFHVLASNPLRLIAIKSVSNILLLIAKICVVFGTVSVAFILLEEKSNQLNYSWSPVVISAIYAYVVAHWFLSVYEMVIDALFICYCEDYELSKSREASVRLTGSNFMTQILNNGQVF